jgi:hypothetical protein
MMQKRVPILLFALIVVIAIVAFARAWRPAAPDDAPHLWAQSPLPTVSPLPPPVAGSLATTSLLVYLPGPDLFLPLVLRQ